MRQNLERVRHWVALLLCAVLVVLASLIIAAPARAETRVALVIGNSNYQAVGTLPNPTRDAALVAQTLKDDGFDVSFVSDASRADMIDALHKFNDQADQADWALVYYAGHGMEFGGVNYLLPTDVRLKVDRDAQDEAISLDRVLETVSGAKKLRLVILDACRDNPFADSMKRSLATRAVDRGLGRPEPQAGIMVVYAAAAGKVAADGDGEHSPFTAALVTRLQQPGLEVSRLFNVVTADVMRATHQHQQPFQYGSNPTLEEFFFKPPKALTADPSAPSPDERIWSYLKASTDGATLKAFHDGLPGDSPLRASLSESRGSLELWDVATGTLLRTSYSDGTHWLTVNAKDNTFIASGDPHDFLAIMRGKEVLPMDDFIKLNRRERLDDVELGAKANP